MTDNPLDALDGRELRRKPKFYVPPPRAAYRPRPDYIPPVKKPFFYRQGRGGQRPVRMVTGVFMLPGQAS